MKKIFDEVSGEVRNLQVSELSAYITKTSAKKFYAKVVCIAELYNSGRYKEQHNSVQEWAEAEFGWNRKQVERYRAAYDLLTRLDHVSNWTHLPINELQCRTLAEFDFETGDLRQVWEAVERAIEGGAKLTGKLIEQISGAMVGSIEKSDPARFEEVVQEITQPQFEEPGVLEYRPEIPFAPSLLDWKENPEASLPGFVPEGKVLVINGRNFQMICQWAACRMDLDFLVLCDFPSEYEEREIPPNVWPGLIVTSQAGLDEAVTTFSKVWSPNKWIWVNLREPVTNVQINADWVVIREFCDLYSLGEILRDTQEAYIMPDAIHRHNRIPRKITEALEFQKK